MGGGRKKAQKRVSGGRDRCAGGTGTRGAKSLKFAKAPAIGIDLGTNYSCVAVFEGDKATIIANEQGHRTTPSYVAFTNTEVLIGEPAKEQALLNSKNTIFGAKRFLGDHFGGSIGEDMKHWPFDVISEEMKAKVKVDYKGETKSFSPEEISSMILRKMKETAEAHLGVTVTDAVINVPAFYNNKQRQAILNSGALAGLKVLRIINDPTAAAIAYGFDKKVQWKEGRNVLIFDLGGGTFDVSILTIEDGIFEVKSTSGDTHLGGEDFTNEMIKYFTEEFKCSYNKDLNVSKTALLRLRAACEKAKIELSTSTREIIHVRNLISGIDFCTQITRTLFEQINEGLFQLILEPVKKVLCDANMDTSQINDIVLIGGSTRIPKIKKLLQDFFNGKELNSSINPDEAVACGAAVQAAILSGDKSRQINNLLVRDITPHSLGIEVADHFMSTLIKRNTTIPTTKTEAFTAKFTEGTLELEVYEGEYEFCEDNNLLGKFAVNETHQLLPRTIYNWDITFDIDANGILSLVVKPTGRKAEVTIKNDKEGFSKEEIEEIVNETGEEKVDDKIKSKNEKDTIGMMILEYEEHDSIRVHLVPLKAKLKTIDKISFLEVEKHFKSIMDIVSLIWNHSRFHSSVEGITVALQEICVTLIKMARGHVGGSSILQIDPKEGLLKAEQVFHILLSFIDIYNEHKNGPPTYFKTGSYSYVLIFQQYNKFLERMKQLLEILTTCLQFNNLHSLDFGESQGNLSAKIAECYKDFMLFYQKWSRVQFKFLNLDAKSFAGDEKLFQEKVTDIDQKLNSLIPKAFKDCQTPQDYFKLILSLGSLVDRHIIREALEPRFLQYIALFEQELQKILDKLMMSPNSSLIQSVREMIEEMEKNLENFMLLKLRIDEKYTQILGCKYTELRGLLENFLNQAMGKPLKRT